MKKYLWVSILMGTVLLSGCSQNEEKKVSASSSSSTETVLSSSSLAMTSAEHSSEESKTETTSQRSSETEATENVELGTIYYEDLDTSDPIQAEAKWLGCYIVDDGEQINLIPMMSATIQNLQLYLSGEGNEDYYNDFLDSTAKVSLNAADKPVNILSKENGEVIITAKKGEIIYSV